MMVPSLMNAGLLRIRPIKSGGVSERSLTHHLNDVDVTFPPEGCVAPPWTDLTQRQRVTMKSLT